MTEPYAQPEPFDPTTMPPTTRRVKARTSPPIVPIVGALVLAIVAFGAGFGVANATAAKTTTGTGANGQALGNGGFGNGNFGPGASGRPRNGFGGGASGTVGSVSANQMTITTANGAQRIVLLTPQTKVSEVTATTKALSDIATGATVTIVGTANPDGSVTATQVILGNLGNLGIFGGRGRPEGSVAPSNAP